MTLVMATQRRKCAVALALMGVVSTIGCSGPQPLSEKVAPTPAATDSFDADLQALCDSLQERSEALEASATKAELEQRSDELVEEQRSFVTEARDFDTPREVADAFEEYVEGVETFAELNEQSLAGKGRREDLRLSLEAAENGVSTFEAKEDADLPESCPPASGGEVYGFLFMAQANVTCYNLGTELKNLGHLQTTTGTREESTKLMRSMRDLATAFVRGIDQSIPPELRDSRVERMIELYEKRIDLFEEMTAAFASEDEAAYNRAFKQQQSVYKKAERLARSFGLTECLNFLGVGS